MSGHTVGFVPPASVPWSGEIGWEPGHEISSLSASHTLHIICMGDATCVCLCCLPVYACLTWSGARGPIIGQAGGGSRHEVSCSHPCSVLALTLINEGNNNRDVLDIRCCRISGNISIIRQHLETGKRHSAKFFFNANSVH